MQKWLKKVKWADFAGFGLKPGEADCFFLVHPGVDFFFFLVNPCADFFFCVAFGDIFLFSNFYVFLYIKFQYADFFFASIQVLTFFSCPPRCGLFFSKNFHGTPRKSNGAPLAANIGPQILARKNWPANSGPQKLARKFWPANFGPQIMARKIWPANNGPQPAF